jgi:hypothetical protein
MAVPPPRPLVGPRLLAGVVAVTLALTLGGPALAREGGALGGVAWLAAAIGWVAIGLAAARVRRGWLAATLLVGGAGLAMLGDRLLELLALQPSGAEVGGALGQAQLTAGAGLVMLVAGAALLLFETARA